MRDEVRLLGRSGGYTDDPARAMPREAEAVDKATQARITLESARSWPGLQALQRGERTQQPIARRVTRALAQAKLAGTDVHKEHRLVRLAMQAGRTEAHIERRVQALEARVFH